jgi:hypothetical protein
MRVEGPNGRERSYTLAGSVGEHEPEAIRILELNIPSYRMEQAKKNRDAGLESAEAK